MSELLVVNNLSKTFRKKGQKDVQALKDISFSLKSGESLGIVGESGSGKSTLARIISGLEIQDEGTCVFLDKEISRYKDSELYANLQMVYQNPFSVFSPRMSIGQALTQVVIKQKVCEKCAIYKYVIHLMASVGLSEEIFLRLPHELSGGQLQRVAIARMLIANPKLVILDEATSSLDVSIQKQLLHLLSELKKSKQLTYIVIGHDLAVVRSLTNRMLVMREGEIVEELESENLVKLARHPYTKKLLNAVFRVKS